MSILTDPNYQNRRERYKSMHQEDSPPKNEGKLFIQLVICVLIMGTVILFKGVELPTGITTGVLVKDTVSRNTDLMKWMERLKSAVARYVLEDNTSDPSKLAGNEFNENSQEVSPSPNRNRSSYFSVERRWKFRL